MWTGSEEADYAVGHGPHLGPMSREMSVEVTAFLKSADEAKKLHFREGVVIKGENEACRHVWRIRLYN